MMKSLQSHVVLLCVHVHVHAHASERERERANAGPVCWKIKPRVRTLCKMNLLQSVLWHFAGKGVNMYFSWSMFSTNCLQPIQGHGEAQTTIWTCKHTQTAKFQEFPTQFASRHARLQTVGRSRAASCRCNRRNLVLISIHAIGFVWSVSLSLGVR